MAYENDLLNDLQEMSDRPGYNGNGSQPPQYRQGGNENFQRGGGGYQQNNNWQNRQGGGNFQRGGNNNWRGGGGFNRGGGNWQNRQGGGNNYRQGGGGGNWQGQQRSQEPREIPTDVKIYKPYLISCNRGTPPEVHERIMKIAKELETLGYTARVGGVEGPEESVEKQYQTHELYLPWKNFNEKMSKNTFNSPESLGIARDYHPAWESIKPAIQAFYAKNVRMVLGQDLHAPVIFSIVWSEDGVEHSKDRNARTGNVGHVIAVSTAVHRPVFNFAKPDAEKRLKQFLGLIPSNEREETQEPESSFEDY